MNDLLVSVIIPCLNEENFIKRCLESLIEQDYPKENLEVLTVDGMSDDKTREIVAGYCKNYSFVKLLDNPKKFTPFAMNIGIKNAKGDFIIFMGAHAKYTPNYISRCVAVMEKSGADNVGGQSIILPQKNDIIGQAIALSISSFAGSGGAVYKTHKGGDIKEVDTVFGGCYKREVFDKIGYFDERLTRTQDLELNIRLKRNGGKIIFDPKIRACYYAPSNFCDFLLYNLKYGRWGIYSWRITGRPLKIRQYLPLIFILISVAVFIINWKLALAGFALYLLAIFFASFKIVATKYNWRLIPLVMLALIIRHFGYGLGSLFGIFKIILQPLKKQF